MEFYLIESLFSMHIRKKAKVLKRKVHFEMVCTHATCHQASILFGETFPFLFPMGKRNASSRMVFPVCIVYLY